MESQTEFITIQPGDRIDILAFKVFGDSSRITDLLELNQTLDIWNPVPGTRIRVPVNAK